MAKAHWIWASDAGCFSFGRYPGLMLGKHSAGAALAIFVSLWQATAYKSRARSGVKSIAALAAVEKRVVYDLAE